MTKEQLNITFEEAMEKLESIVGRLEDGEVPLEESINLYKEGMELSKWCHDKLKTAEEQLTLIMKDDALKPFSIAEEE
ncbi:exodeoxyribonuclease VII small subunit [Pradoshia eiseniae]|uniref:Exodeoxyribonuclease 7 small subunit n=1 Tax=Pradoshia eiseniae TaxID=2064768 RepID=A0A2S7N3I5_9BACI|nr:exodeoxyribonuclease VII small subunit [Pradoshia eiseniae]PQD96563.1 exodeoxyribonuclease VII small subunit [Pradoshia eiseniae]